MPACTRQSLYFKMASASLTQKNLQNGFIRITLKSTARRGCERLSDRAHEATVAYFKAARQHLLGVVEETHENLQIPKTEQVAHCVRIQ
jgi:hypothetical protein